MSHPDRVEAVLLDLPKNLGRNDPEPREYEVVSEAYTVPPEVARDVSEALTTPNLHRMIDPGAKSCTTRYGVRMSYYAGDDRLDLYFCFTCMDLAVYLNDKPVGAMQFIFICKRLLTDMKAIFPDRTEFVDLAEHCLRRSN